MAAVMYQARDLVLYAANEYDRYPHSLDEVKQEVRPEWRENWYDGLGYCKSLG